MSIYIYKRFLFVPYAKADSKLGEPVVQLLRIAGADPNKRGPAGITRLYQAAASGDIENVKFLLQNSVNPSITTNYG